MERSRNSVILLQFLRKFFSEFFKPKMTNLLRYGAPVLYLQEKVRDTFKETKYITSTKKIIES
jgi:hypothetical protein